MWHCRVDTETTHGPWAEHAAHLLRHGSVLAYPTDTLYGLAADPRHAEAVGTTLSYQGTLRRSGDSSHRG